MNIEIRATLFVLQKNVTTEKQQRKSLIPNFLIGWESRKIRLEQNKQKLQDFVQIFSLVVLHL